jgi:hypothetical protein
MAGASGSGEISLPGDTNSSLRPPRAFQVSWPCATQSSSGCVYLCASCACAGAQFSEKSSRGVSLSPVVPFIVSLCFLFTRLENVGKALDNRQVSRLLSGCEIRTRIVCVRVCPCLFPPAFRPNGIVLKIIFMRNLF